MGNSLLKLFVGLLASFVLAVGFLLCHPRLLKKCSFALQYGRSSNVPCCD